MDWMSRYDHSKEKNRRRHVVSLDSGEGSAARTRPFSLEEIMLRRKNKEFPETLKDGFEKKKTNMLKSVVEIVSHRLSSEKKHAESANGYSASRGHVTTNNSKRSSRKKVENVSREEDYIDDNSRENHLGNEKLRFRSMRNRESAKANESEKRIYGKRKHDKILDNEHLKGRAAKDANYLQMKGKHVDSNRENFEKERKKRHDVEGNNNSKDDFLDTMHEKYRNDMRKHSRDTSDNYLKEADKKFSRYPAGKSRYSDKSREKYESESERKHENLNDERWNMYAARKNNLDYHLESELLEREDRRERMKSHHEESRVKRGRSRSREREERRKRFPSVSPKACSYPDEESKESMSQSLKDRSKKQQTIIGRDISPTNGSGRDHRKHEESLNKLGGYSPRKRKSETSTQTNSPSTHSQKRKGAGWDLPPQGKEGGLSDMVPSNLLSSHSLSSNPQHLTSASTTDSALLKSLPVAHVSSPKEINASIDSVHLTQATRPRRRLYLENLPPSASEKAVLDSLNSLLLSTGINRIQGAQPCIGCTIHKEKCQALVEFLTPEDASSALSFDGSAILGSFIKIRRPKDYVEVANDDSERSIEAAITVSDIVKDSPDKVFIGGVSTDLSPEMLLEIASAFGSLKAFHFELSNIDGPCAFMEYVDHSVTAKACAGLNGMKLAGKVLTVVQAMPNMSSSEDDRCQPCYNVPELAKPLLKEPTEVLKLSNVFNAETISSLTEGEMQEVMEDIRLECARFGTVKSINVVKHVGQTDHATHLETHELVKDVGETSAQPSFVEPKTDQGSRDTSEHVVDCAIEEPKAFDFAQCATFGDIEFSVQITGKVSHVADQPEDKMDAEDTGNENKQDDEPRDADAHPEEQTTVEDNASEMTRDDAPCDASHPEDQMTVEDTSNEEILDETCDTHLPENHVAVDEPITEKRQDEAPCEADHPEDNMAVEESAYKNTEDETPCDADKPEDHMAVEDTVNEKTKDGTIQNSLDAKLQTTFNEVSDVIEVDHRNSVEALEKSRLTGGDSELQYCPTGDASRESPGVECESNAEQVANHESVFELGSVFVEYRRTEASCMAAHCMHGRSFDQRTVMVEYVPLHLYRAKFSK